MMLMPLMMPPVITGLMWKIKGLSARSSLFSFFGMVIDKTVYGRMTPARVREILSKGK
jgi:hypothetical protein